MLNSQTISFNFYLNKKYLYIKFDILKTEVKFLAKICYGLDTVANSLLIGRNLLNKNNKINAWIVHLK